MGMTCLSLMMMMMMMMMCWCECKSEVVIECERLFRTLVKERELIDIRWCAEYLCGWCTNNPFLSLSSLAKL